MRKEINMYHAGSVEAIPADIMSKICMIDTENIIGLFIDPFTFNIGFVCDDNKDKVLGAGIIRVVNEFKMILDQKLSSIEKTRVMNILMNRALRLKSCNDVIISLTIPREWDEREHYADIIEKHYGFHRDSGIVLRLEV